jgi:hypothetical protein
MKNEMNTVCRSKGIFLAITMVIVLIPFRVGAGEAGSRNGNRLKPILRRLLSETDGLSERDRALYAYVIEHYLSECPEKRFKFTRLEEALRMEDPGDSTLIVNTSVACDDAKDKPEMVFSGEYLRLNPDFSLRARLDAYKPVGDLARKLKEAQKRLEEEKCNPPPEPTKEELRSEQTSALLSLLDKERNVTNKERLVFSEVIPQLPLCPEETASTSFKAIRDAVWLRPFNNGYLAVSLVVCGWNDLAAFWLDENGRLIGRFAMPAGKYGLSSAHELRISDFTGDGEEEFFYRKIFPTSSVPVFTTWAYLYKLKEGENSPQPVLEVQVDEQDCFEAERNGDNIGNRTTAGMEFVPAQGLIKITDEESTFDCDDFSWGEKPVRTLKVLSMKHRTMKWDPSRFSYFPER